MRLYPVNPQSLASYRKAYAPSGAKSDPADAALLMGMVRHRQSGPPGNATTPTRAARSC